MKRVVSPRFVIGMLQCIALLIGLTIYHWVAADETSSGLKVETIAERRIVDPVSGRAEFRAATQLKLGDEVFYTLRVRNVTNAPLREVVVTKEVPRNISYLADSAVGPAATVTFSIDGAHFESPESLNASELSDSSTQPARAARADEYTHIRWQLHHPLAPDATALLRFRGTFH